jgi:hypothetical protein
VNGRARESFGLSAKPTRSLFLQNIAPPITTEPVYDSLSMDSFLNLQMQSLSEAANYSGYQTRMSLFSTRQGRKFCEYDVRHIPLLELLQRNHNSANVQQVCVYAQPKCRRDDWTGVRTTQIIQRAL